jgi:hypothetical protein
MAFSRALAGAAFMVALIMSGVPATAADDRETCRNASGDVAITACTRLIESGKYGGHDLAILYTNRGVEYSLKRDLDRAIADLTAAHIFTPARYRRRSPI